MIRDATTDDNAEVHYALRIGRTRTITLEVIMRCFPESAVVAIVQAELARREALES